MVYAVGLFQNSNLKYFLNEPNINLLITFLKLLEKNVSFLTIDKQNGTANNISNIELSVLLFTQSLPIMLTFFVGPIFFEQYEIDQNYL